eukprot:gene11915-5320_t
MNLLSETSKKNFQICLDDGICIRCSLYFSDFNVHSILLKPEQELFDLFQVTNNNCKCCKTCFGILSDKLLLNEFMNQIEINSKEYDFKYFTLLFSFPHSLMLRHYSINYKLNQKQKTIYENFRKFISITLKVLIESRKDLKYIQPLANIGLVFSIKFEHEETSNEHEVYLKFENPKKKQKTEKNQTGNENQKKIQNAIERKDFEDVFLKDFVPPKEVNSFVNFRIEISSNSIYLTGNYNKFERGISQTEWIINNNKLTENSVEEYLTKPIKEITKSNDFSFHSSGREDVDVRMLGNGRPFLLEIKNSKIENLSENQLTSIMKEINENEKVGINSLKMTKNTIFKEIHDSSEEKKKKYRCVVWLEKVVNNDIIEKINSLEEFKIHQKTPIRVLHRRNNDTRERLIYKIEASKINHHFLILDLTTQAGTYIKEFVHGDLGRTIPSLGSILECNADILQLDVLDLIF